MTTALVSGTVLGVVYALIAAVLVFTYQATGVLNFALGGFALVAAFSFSTLSSDVAPWIAWLSIVVAAVPAGLLIGFLTLAAQRASVEVKAAASLATAVAVEGLVVLVWGTNPRAATYVISGTAFDLGGVPVTWERILAAGIALAGCVVLAYTLRATRIGSAVRAMSRDDTIGRLIGLPATRLWMSAWMLSTVLITVVIIVVLPDVGVSTDSLTFVVLTPLAAALVARLRSVPVAAVSALALGVIEGACAGTNSLSAYQELCPLVAAVAGLMLAEGGVTSLFRSFGRSFASRNNR